MGYFSDFDIQIQSDELLEREYFELIEQISLKEFEKKIWKIQKINI